MCPHMYLQIIACCINLQLPKQFFVKSIISDMHHRIKYMYINFQQYRVSRSVKTMGTNIFAKNCKLHKFATTYSIFFLNRLLKTCIIIKRTCISIISNFLLISQNRAHKFICKKLKIA